MKNTLLIALLAALGAPGCYLDLSGDPAPPNRPGPRVNALPDGGVDAGDPDAGWGDTGPWDPDVAVWAPGENSLAVTSVVLSGEIGPVSSDNSAEFFVNESFDSSRFAHIDLRSQTESGVLMNLLSIENHELLEVGRNYYTDATTDPASVYVTVIGCSGPQHDLWDADSPSESVILYVREGPEEGSAELFYNARFRNGDTVEGSFVMPLTR